MAYETSSPTETVCSNLFSEEDTPVCHGNDPSGKIEPACHREFLVEKEESNAGLIEDFTDDDESVSSQREMEFCELYFKVIDKQLARGDYEENIEQAWHYFSEIRSKTNRWCAFRKNNDSEEIKKLKNSFYYRMLYIYSNATCISSAVAYHFQNFLNRNSKSLKKLLKKKVLKICSIGGGMPADVVALIKVLETSFYLKDDLQIHITIIDVDKKWKKPCIAILHSMENFSKEKWKIDFLSFDVSSEFTSSKIKTAILEADLVSFFKFLNQLEDQDIEFKRNLFQKLHHLITPGAVLFLMDHAHIEVMKVFSGYLGRLQGHKLLYEVACRLHLLQQTTVKRHFHLYSKHLISSGMCNTSFKLFCRAWIRTNESFPYPGNVPKSFDPEIRKAERSLEEKRAWQARLRLLWRQLNNDNKISKDMVYWRDTFAIEMKNQGCSEGRIRRTLDAAEKSIFLRKMYAKQLMFASYDDFLEEAEEIRAARKESDETLKSKKRKDFYRKIEEANEVWRTYDSFVRNLLIQLERIRCSKDTQTGTISQNVEEFKDRKKRIERICTKE